MWYVISLIAIAVALYFSASHCESGRKPTNVSSGLVSYGKETLNGIKGNGFVTLEGTTVKGSVEVNGNLNAKDAKMASLAVNGNASLTNSHVTGKSDVAGFLSASGTKFGGDIAISSKTLTLENSQAPHILVRKTGWAFGSQTVELSQKSRVTGGITFESGSGLVIVSGDSQLSGPVVGGTVEKR